MKINGNLKWIVALFLTALIGIGGWYSFAVQNIANQDHKLFIQEIAQKTHEDDAQNAILISNTNAITAIKEDIAAIKATQQMMMDILKKGR